MLALNEGDSALELRITGLDRILACKSSIVIPYSQISNVLARPEAAAFWFPTGVRFGTHLPGVVKKGSWFKFDSTDFFFVTNPDLTFEIELMPNNTVGYRKLILQVPTGLRALLQIIIHCDLFTVSNAGDTPESWVEKLQSRRAVT
jgi:hypothetical protein